MINRELFKRIHEVITTHPEHHDQGTYEEDVDGQLGYLQPSDPDYASDRKCVTTRIDGAPVCGTTRCTAGWALYLHNPEQDITKTAQEVLESRGLERGYSDLFEGARALLGLSPEQADEMFSGALRETEAVRLVAEYAGITQ